MQCQGGAPAECVRADEHDEVVGRRRSADAARARPGGRGRGEGRPRAGESEYAGNGRLLASENGATTSRPETAVTAVGRSAAKGAVAGGVIVTGSTPGAAVADAAGARSSGGRKSTVPGYAGTMLVPS